MSIKNSQKITIWNETYETILEIKKMTDEKIVLIIQKSIILYLKYLLTNKKDYYNVNLR
jgi:hypothetical protein